MISADLLLWVALGAVGFFLAGLCFGGGVWCGHGFWQARADRRTFGSRDREDQHG